MLRNLLLALGTVVGLLGSSAWISTAEAGPKVSIGIGYGQPGYYPPYQSYYPGYSNYPNYPARDNCRHYHVLYRTCRGEPWRVYGTYQSHYRAHAIEDYLEARGYDARIDHD